MGELIIRTDVNELKNSGLRTECRKINNAVKAGNKAMWSIADALKRVVRDELFADDFPTQNGFASYVGLSNSNLSKLVNISEYSDSVDELRLYTVSKACEMLTIPVDSVKHFLDTMDVTPSWTVKEIRDAVREYKQYVEYELCDADADADTSESYDADADAVTSESCDTDAGADIDDFVDLNINARVCREFYEEIKAVAEKYGYKL